MADLMVTGEGLGRHGAAGLPPDEPIDVGRYVSALRRSWPLILLIIAALTSAVYLASLTLSERYRATAKIVVERTADPLDSEDVLSLERRLATIQALLTTRETFRRAARQLRGERAATLDDKVTASVDQNANIINVVATDDTSRGAAAIANAVATTFLADERRAERRRLNRARATLLRALADLEGRRGIPAAEERASIRERLTDLNLGVASSSSARPPGHQPTRTRLSRSGTRSSRSSRRPSSRASSSSPERSSSRALPGRGS
jgi:Chain length determinant protein